MKLLLLLHLVLLSGVCRAAVISDGNPLQMPRPGDYGLRIISPTVVELTLITTKQPDPAPGTQWNFVGTNGEVKLPLPGAFKVTAGSDPMGVQAVGFKRRVIYAPLKVRDLRIANHLYLRLAGAVREGQQVEVTNPDGKLWASAQKFSAQADPLRYSPAIHVNQEGYMPGLPKKALVGFYLGNMGELPVNAAGGFKIVNATNGAVAFEGKFKNRIDVGFNYNPVPYQRVLEADFSAFNSPGYYKLQVPGLGASYSFSINDGIATGFARTYALGLYHQRCGAANALPYTRHTHGPCHTAPVEVPTSSKFVNSILASETGNYKGNPKHTAPQLKDVNSSLYPFINKAPFNASGGHHDAGDYSKYTINVAQLVHTLMFVADAFPGAADIDNLGLPESNDGKGDILQMAKWEADFLAKMQDADGGFYFLVYPRERRYEDNVLPDAGDRQVVFPKTTSATAAAVAALAEAGSSPEMKKQFPEAAAVYLEKAKKGWGFLQKAIAKHGRDGSYQKITHYGDQFMHDDELVWAAAAMFVATGDKTAHDDLKKHFDPTNQQTYHWSWWRMFEAYGCAIRTYGFAVRTGRLKQNQISSSYLAKCESEIMTAGMDQARWSKESAYGLSFPDASKRFRTAGWFFGTERVFDSAAALALGSLPEKDHNVLVEAILANLNYEAGCNPNNVTFVSGIGWKRLREMVHHVAQNDRRVLPPTGLPTGNLQPGFMFLHHYGRELGSLSYPTDGHKDNPYAFYDRYADTFHTGNEFVTPVIARSLGSALVLMAVQKQSIGAGWKPPGATIVRSGNGYSLKPSLALEGTPRVVWEMDGKEPEIREGWNLPMVTGTPKWIEAEAQFPDGRRVFGVLNLRN